MKPGKKQKQKKEIQLCGFQHCITLKNMPSGSDISEMCIVCIFFSLEK